LQDRLDFKELQVRRVYLGMSDSLDFRERTLHTGHKDFKGGLVLEVLALWVGMASLETPGQLVFVVHMEQLENVDYLVLTLHTVLLEEPDLLEAQDIWVPLVFLGTPVRLVPLVLQGLPKQVQRVKQELRVQRLVRVQRVQPDSLV
jgi:hypothetical protein